MTVRMTVFTQQQHVTTNNDVFMAAIFVCTRSGISCIDDRIAFIVVVSDMRLDVMVNYHTMVVE